MQKFSLYKMHEYIWFDIGSGNALLSDGIKPSPEAVLICRQEGSVPLAYLQDIIS